MSDHRAAYAEALKQRQALIDLASEVLRSFTEQGHPGRPCVRTGWVSIETFHGWWETLRSMPAIDTSPLFDDDGQERP